MRRARKGIFRSAFVICTVLATAATSAGTAGATFRIPIDQPSGQGLGRQFQAAYDSAAGQQVRGQLAAIITDPAVPAIATSLLKAAGPSGTNSLTDFQVQMLRAVQIEAGHSALLAALLTGRPLTLSQRLELPVLGYQFDGNPAVQAFTRAGQQLEHSAQLSSVVSAATATDSQVFSTLTPPSSVSQGGSTDIDTAIDEVAAWRTSQAFTTFDTELASALSDPGLVNLVREQNPTVVAGFLSPQQLAALTTTSLHLDAYTLPVTPLTPIQTDEFNLAGLTFTLIGAVVAFAFFTPPGALIAGTILLSLGILAYAAFAVPVATDLAAHLDCDNDGDLFDPADGTPSDPCPGL